MLTKLLIAWSLMALCVMVHAMGMTALLRWVSQADHANRRALLVFDLDARPHCRMDHSPASD